MVEFCSRRCYVSAVIPDCERTRTPAGRRGCTRCHRCSSDRAGPGKAVRRAGIRSRCVDSFFGKTPSPTPFFYNKPRPSTTLVILELSSKVKNGCARKFLKLWDELYWSGRQDLNL